MHRRMLTLINIIGAKMQIPYEPEMRMGQYLREVIAQALHIPVIFGNTVPVHVQTLDKKVVFNEKNCGCKLKSLIPDGTMLFFAPTMMGSQGNAGDQELHMECAICLEKESDKLRMFKLVCGHSFHCECLHLMHVNNSQRHVFENDCPLCNNPISYAENEAVDTHMRFFSGSKKN